MSTSRIALPDTSNICTIYTYIHTPTPHLPPSIISPPATLGLHKII